MNLQTLVDIPELKFQLNCKEKGLFVGSCFATSLEKYLSYRKANVEICPYGEMYNPKSIESYFLKKQFSQEDIVKSRDGLWYSWYHHGSVYAEDEEQLLKKINVSVPSEAPEYVVITLGSSWVYELSDGRIVSNCHKMPSSIFRRRCLSLDEILNALRNIINALPKAKFIITVSPIRHIKDGLIENSYSKSLLRVAAGLISNENERVYYYPSYEIMNDELRDYRFYKEDMLHPSDQAASYIMDRFIKVAFDQPSQLFFQDVLKLRHAMEHRPLHTESPMYQDFLKYIQRLRDEMRAKYPEVDFSD